MDKMERLLIIEPTRSKNEAEFLAHRLFLVGESAAARCFRILHSSDGWIKKMESKVWTSKSRHQWMSLFIPSHPKTT